MGTLNDVRNVKLILLFKAFKSFLESLERSILPFLFLLHDNTLSLLLRSLQVIHSIQVIIDFVAEVFEVGNSLLELGGFDSLSNQAGLYYRVATSILDPFNDLLLPKLLALLVFLLHVYHAKDVDWSLILLQTGRLLLVV